MSFKRKLLLVDGHALLYRAFHAIPNLTNREGFPTGAIFGFFSILLKSLADIKPSHLVVTFDAPSKNFRHTLSGDYKAHRKPTPDDLVLQIPKVKELLAALNIPMYEKEGFEADDILGIICHQTPKDMQNIILTGDMDMLQLINENTVVYRLKTGISEVVIFDERNMQEQFGLKPTQWVDFKALKGDASDNIPGVPGVGEKTALILIQNFGDLDNLYAMVEEEHPDIKKSVLKKLSEGKHYAYLSQKLAKIDGTHKFEFNLDETEVGGYDQDAVVRLFQELGIKSLIPRLPSLPNQAQNILAKKTETGNGILVDTAEKLEELIKNLEKQSGIAINVETTNALPLNAELIGLSFCYEESRAYYVPVYQNPQLDALGKLKKVLESKFIEKWGHDVKFDALVLKKYGIDLNPLVFDTMLAAYLLNPGLRSYDLPSLGFAELGLQKQPVAGFEEKAWDKIPWEKLTTEQLCFSSCEDVSTSFKLKDKLAAELKNKKLWELYQNIELPLVPVLQKMEEAGVLLDKKFLAKLSADAKKQIAKLEKEIYKLSGEEFNISSPIQLREVLFEKLKIPTDVLRKRGKSGALSTAANELEKLRGLHPVIDLIFEYRELTKLKSTYLDSLPELVSILDNRLHTSFRQTIAATGRLSSSDPNLQNIPIRTDMGRQVRKAFVAEEGFILASLDYSQIELRIAASLSNDPEMVKIFKGGQDFHTATAARIFNVMESAVTPAQRRDAKTINFSVLYGVSAFGLSERSEMARGEASDFIKRYYQVFAKLKEYIDNCIKEVHETGFTKNALGRLRFYPEINASNFAVRGAAERAAVNMPIQSLSADIIKIAMIQVAKDYVSDDCRMVLSVHDELVFEIKKGKEREYIPKIKEIMEKAYKLKVPIVVEAKTGQDWMEMSPYRNV